MAEIKVSYHLVPDGISSIVQFEIRGEFYVETAEAARQAEEGMVKIITRVTARPESAIRDELELNRWIGEGWRPDEPTVPEGEAT